MGFSGRRAWLAVSLLPVAACFASVARADCTFGTPSGGEPTLQVSLGNFLQTPPNTVTGCLADGTGPGGDAYWSSVGGTSATLLLEIAGFASVNSFGIFDAANPANSIMVFSGPTGPWSRAQIAFGPDGTVTVTSGNQTRTAQFGSAAFGFYLLTGENRTMHSDSTLNVGGADRMYAYQGNGSSIIAGPTSRDTNPNNDIFGPTDVILAYEDLVAGDNDFQDFVVLVRGVVPVPLPAAAWLLGVALVGLRIGARRRPGIAS